MTDLDLQRWRPELRRALMKARPEYFGWSAKAQERYGVCIPKEDRARLEQALLYELFGRTSRSLKAEQLPIDKKNIWNETILPLVGVGEDSFYLNTWLAENRTILDFDTLRAYDEDDYRFQEEARKKEDGAYAGRAYRGALYLTWARLFVGTQFTYATLSMAGGYVFAKLTDTASDLIQACIPHRLVRGKHHGKAEGKQWEWDMRVEAGGQEALLEELRHRVFDYEFERYDALLSAWDQAEQPGVYLIDTSEPPEHNLHVVFSNKDALAYVRFQFFVRDCQAIERPRAELEQAIAEEKTALEVFIQEQHQDLLNHFDPTVPRLRKRRRIMVHNDAFEGLAPAIDDKS